MRYTNPRLYVFRIFRNAGNAKRWWRDRVGTENSIIGLQDYVSPSARSENNTEHQKYVNEQNNCHVNKTIQQ